MKDGENIVSDNIRTKARNEKGKIQPLYGSKKVQRQREKRWGEMHCARNLGTDREAQGSKGAENTSSKPEGGNKCLFLTHTFLI